MGKFFRLAKTGYWFCARASLSDRTERSYLASTSLDYSTQYLLLRGIGLEELSAVVRHQIPVKPKRNILELEGLGKEIWQGLDAQEYVDQERTSWNG